jgi:nucleotide-binding universal stress UspA family protein
MMSTSTIIWASDGSEHADRALEHARRLGICDGATVTVVHSEEYLLGPRAMGDTPLHADENEIKTKLQQQVQTLNAGGVTADLRVVQPGAPGTAHAITEVADELDAKLIVVGTRGRSPIAGLLLGGVTQRLLHFAHCPVLAVPPTE